ncbi:MAG: helix-turn-helix domain-containing protein [Rhizobiales bacterium]|nr:helix-turn-helix domain-containing protein [Hyphomicrobiales bacterium]
MTDEILTIREMAEFLKINEKTAYKLALAGEIPGFKVGGSWRFERQEIARWIKRKIEEQKKGATGGDNSAPC